MNQEAINKIQGQERDKSFQKNKAIQKFRKGIGYSILIIFLAVAVLSAISLVNLPDAQWLKMAIIAITIGSVIFMVFHSIVFHFCGYLARNIFSSVIILLTALSIYLIQ